MFEPCRTPAGMARATLLASFLLLAASACDQLHLTPPLAIEFRDSTVQMGHIVHLTNASTDPLTGLEIKITNPNGDVKHHKVDSLAPGAGVEVGWLRLHGFQVERGAKVSVRCNGYLLPYLAKLSAGPDRSGSLHESE